MIGAILLIGYVVGAICSIPWVARAMLKADVVGTATMEDYVLCVGVAMILSLFWPFSLAVVGVAKAMKREDEGVKPDERVEWP